MPIHKHTLEIVKNLLTNNKQCQNIIVKNSSLIEIQLQSFVLNSYSLQQLFIILFGKTATSIDDTSDPTTKQIISGFIKSLDSESLDNDQVEDIKKTFSSMIKRNESALDSQEVSVDSDEEYWSVPQNRSEDKKAAQASQSPAPFTIVVPNSEPPGLEPIDDKEELSSQDKPPLIREETSLYLSQAAATLRRTVVPSSPLTESTSSFHTPPSSPKSPPDSSDDDLSSPSIASTVLREDDEISGLSPQSSEEKKNPFARSNSVPSMKKEQNKAKYSSIKDDINVGRTPPVSIQGRPSDDSPPPPSTPPPIVPLGDGAPPPPPDPPVPAPSPILPGSLDGKPGPTPPPISPVPEPSPILPGSPDGKPVPVDPPIPTPHPSPGSSSPRSGMPLYTDGPLFDPPSDAPPLIEVKGPSPHIPPSRKPPLSRSADLMPPRDFSAPPPPPLDESKGSPSYTPPLSPSISPTADEKIYAQTATNLGEYRDDPSIKARFDLAHNNLKQLVSAAQKAENNALSQLTKGISATKKLITRFEDEVKKIDPLIIETKKNHDAAEKVLKDAEKRLKEERDKVLAIRKARKDLKNGEAILAKGGRIKLNFPDKNGKMTIHFVSNLDTLKNTRKKLEKNIFKWEPSPEGKHTKQFLDLQKQIKIARHHLNARQDELKKVTEAKKWRSEALADLNDRETNLKAISPSTTKIPVFSRVFEEDKAKVYKTEAEFNDWKREIEDKLGSTASLAVVLHGRSKTTVDSIERNTDHTNVYRAFPPNIDNIKKSDLIYAELQSNKDAKNEYQNYELTVYDLPKEISRRGILLEFLNKNYKNIVYRETDPSIAGWEKNKAVDNAALEKMIFALPPSLTERDILKFLEEKVRVGNRLTSNSSILNDFKKDYKNATTMFWGWNSDPMPNQRMLNEARRIVDILINGSPKGSRYIEIDHIENDQLAVALRIVIEVNAKEIKEKCGKQFIIPENFPKATPAQIKAASGNERCTYFDYQSGKQHFVNVQVGIKSTANYVPENMENLSPPTSPPTPRRG